MIIQQTGKEHEQYLQAVSASWNHRSQVKRPGSPTALLAAAVTAQDAFADLVALSGRGLLVNVAVGNPLTGLRAESASGWPGKAG